RNASPGAGRSFCRGAGACGDRGRRTDGVARAARGVGVPGGGDRWYGNLCAGCAPPTGDGQRAPPARAGTGRTSFCQAAGAEAGLNGRRLDQWLWFARLVKSRSRAARLCTAGAVAVNGITVKKVNHILRTGESVTVHQGAFSRTVRVLA